MTIKSNNYNKKGFALITLIFFMVIISVVMSAAVAVIIINSKISTHQQQSTIALSIAESGIENALLRLLRDPNYSGESNLYIGGGKADITVDGPTIISIGSYMNFKRKIKVTANYDNQNKLIITNWREIY